MNDQPFHLYLVRHGQTALNAEGRLRGLADPPLDEVGIAEAHAVANALSTRAITRVRCSPLDRAVTTARIIAEQCGCTAEPDPAFNDRDYGLWTSHVKQEVIDEFGTVDAAPGVEPAFVVRDRALAALDEMARAGEGAACVVTHDAVIRPILQTVDPTIIDAEVLTGSWNELVSVHGRWSVELLDQKG